MAEHQHCFFLPKESGSENSCSETLVLYNKSEGKLPPGHRERETCACVSLSVCGREARRKCMDIWKEKDRKAAGYIHPHPLNRLHLDMPDSGGYLDCRTIESPAVCLISFQIVPAAAEGSHLESHFQPLPVRRDTTDCHCAPNHSGVFTSLTKSCASVFYSRCNGAPQ